MLIVFTLLILLGLKLVILVILSNYRSSCCLMRVMMSTLLQRKSSFGHCVVCTSSFGHCVVCPSIYDIVSERRISRNSRDDMTFDNMGNTNPTKTSKKWWRTQVLRKGRQFPASHVVPVKLLPPRSRGYLSKYLVSHLRILWVFVLSYNLLF